MFTDNRQIGPMDSKHTRINSADRTQGDNVPPRLWLDSAEELVNKAQQWLNSAHGTKALAYLYVHGFTDKTIAECKIGYIPAKRDGSWLKQSVTKWGLPITDPAKPYVTLCEGILIPWYVGQQIWKLEVHRFTEPADSQHKNTCIRGSREIIYNINALRVDQTVVVCNSTFDAISGIQACQGAITFIAPGEIKNQAYRLWAQKCLQSARRILTLSANEANHNCFRSFSDTTLGQNLPQSIRIHLWDKNLNTMLQHGVDLHFWLKTEMETLKLCAKSNKPFIPTFAERMADLEAAEHKESGLYPKRSPICCQCSAPSEHFSPSGDAYCTEHYMCTGGHPPQWVLSAHNIWLCACVHKRRLLYL
jgi:hypothetical protein